MSLPGGSRQATTVLDAGVLGHQRNRNDQLVLDQLRRLQAPVRKLERLEPCRRHGRQRGGIGHDDFDAVRELVPKRLEATLTDELDGGPIIELHAEPAIASLLEIQRCTYTARVRVKQALEPRQQPDVELAAERNPSIRQRFQIAQTVPSVQRAGHRPRIICEQVSGVKTVSYEKSRPVSIAPMLILASTSPYRRELLARLKVPFAAQAPGVAEVAVEGEEPAAMAARLALAKARSIVTPHALVVGSDQVASLDGRILRKPGSAEAAVAQLRACQGRTVLFHTGAAIVATDSGETLTHVDCTEVRFRRLDRAALEQYVRLERPFDCAGSFKSEGLGVALFERIVCDDPTALIGLPLIFVADALRQLGADPLRPSPS